MTETPLFGTTIRHGRVARAHHHLPDEIVVAGLIEDMNFLANPEWYACVVFANGRWTMRGPTDISPAPQQDQSDKMLHVALMANRELHLFGHWITWWARGRLSAAWRDRDGDLQFYVVFDEPWHRVMAWSDDRFVAPCIEAYDGWVELMRAVDVPESARIKRALGQRPHLTL